jgi:hypothetical protein
MAENNKIYDQILINTENYKALLQEMCNLKIELMNLNIAITKKKNQFIMEANAVTSEDGKPMYKNEQMRQVYVDEQANKLDIIDKIRELEQNEMKLQAMIRGVEMEIRVQKTCLNYLAGGDHNAEYGTDTV